MKKTVLKNCIAWAAATVALIGVWLIAYYAVGNSLLVPSFSDCMQKLGELFVSNVFWMSFFMTLKRVLIAFLIAFVFSAIFAIIAYLLPWFSVFFAPIVSVLRSMPVLGVLLIILVWSGADTAPIIVAFLSLFPMLYAGFGASLMGVDKRLVEMSHVYQVPIWRQIWLLYIPSAAPMALRETTAALSFCVKLVVSAEVLANTWKSLGGMMQEAKLYLDMPLLFALVCITFLTGLLLETIGGAIAAWVERSCK